MIDIQWYEQTSLAQDYDIKPLQVIEAFPLSQATTPFKGEPNPQDPSGVFGYIVGRAIKPTGLVAVGKNGVELLNHEACGCYGGIRGLSKFGDKEVYLLVGEIKGIIINNTSGQLPSFFAENARFLSPSLIEKLQPSIAQHLASRSRKEYVFEAPDRRAYALSEILLNLREKRQ